MSFPDESQLDAFLHRDHLLPQISAETVAKSLDGFPLPLQHGRDMKWLAMATRRALAITIGNVEDGPTRKSNAEIRSELERLTNLAESTWLELFQCNQAADSQLWDFANRNWNGEGGADIGESLAMGEPSEYARFKAIVQELDWLSSFLRDAARETDSQRGPWRQSEQKRLRIRRAQYLAPIFEAAFGQPVSANNWPSGAHREPSAFMDYYQRMVSIGFEERATPDISGVLKEACKLHRKQPAQFPNRVIPGL